MGDEQNNGNDPLYVSDDYFNPNRDEEVLPEDNNSPAAPADDVPDPKIPDDYPTLDDGVDEDEAYTEGLAHAAGIGLQEIKPIDRAGPLELEPEEDAKS
jgi:hypothetical protein